MSATPPQFTAPMIDTAAKTKALDGIYNPQSQFIESQIEQLPQYYGAQKASIEQAKTNAFRDIGDTAQKRGMFFSGFQPAENARYLGEKYLPGLMEVDNQMNRERQGLLGQIVGLNADRGQQMLGYSDKNDDRTYDAAGMNYNTNTDWWNTNQQWGRDDRLLAEANAREDAIRAEQNAIDESQFSRSMATTRGSSSYTGGGGSETSRASAAKVYGDALASRVGGDGNVSPESYRQARAQFVIDGEGDGRAFDDAFWKTYVNEDHWQDYIVYDE